MERHDKTDEMESRQDIRRGASPAGLRGGHFREGDPNSTYGHGTSPSLQDTGLRGDDDRTATSAGNKIPYPGVYSAPLVDRLSKHAAYSNDQVIALNRAVNILREHPEFEELIWIIDNRHHFGI